MMAKHTGWRCLLGVVGSAVLLAGSAPALDRGLTWEAKVTADAGEPTTMRVLTAGQRFKIDQHGEGKQYLVRLDRDEAYFIDTKKRTYQKIKLTELERAAETAQAQMQAALGKMQKELQNLPPEQRRMVEQMMGERARGSAAPAAKPSVRKTGQTKTIAGYRCEEYVAEVDGKPLLKACTTQDIAAFNQLRDDWLASQRRLGKLNPFGGGSVYEAFGQIPGFPLETEMSGVHAVVTKVDPSTPPASEFEVPAGFELRPGPHLPNMPQ